MMNLGACWHALKLAGSVSSANTRFLALAVSGAIQPAALDDGPALAGEVLYCYAQQAGWCHPVKNP
jgi:hypothetical protein